MRKALLLSTALTLGALNPAFAGGPVVIEDVVEVVPEKPASSAAWVLPVLKAAVIIAIVVGGDDDEIVQISDRRLKEDITRVGTNRLGLGVYRYRYRGMEGVYEGVMAQEVQVMHPGAVRTLPQGYLAVNHAKLGIEMRRVA